MIGSSEVVGFGLVGVCYPGVVRSLIFFFLGGGWLSGIFESFE